MIHVFQRFEQSVGLCTPDERAPLEASHVSLTRAKRTKCYATGQMSERCARVPGRSHIISTLWAARLEKHEGYNRCLSPAYTAPRIVERVERHEIISKWAFQESRHFSMNKPACDGICRQSVCFLVECKEPLKPEVGLLCELKFSW